MSEEHRPSSVAPGRPGSGVYPSNPLGENHEGISTGRDVEWEPLVDFRRLDVSENTIHGAVAWVHGNEIIHSFGGNVLIYGRSMMKPIIMKIFIDELADVLTDEQKIAKIPLFRYLQPELQRRSAVVGYAAIADTNRVNDLLRRPEARLALRNDLRLLWEAKPNQNFAALYAIRDDSRKGKAKLSGKSIVDARVSYDEIGDVVVSMTMDSEGAGIWGRMTTECAADNQRAVAVVLDGLVFSAPSVQTAITSGRSQISFGSDQSIEQKMLEANDLAGLLKAGSLPAPARIVDEVSVGPQLGEENIQSGLSSFVIALLVILLYMIFYYKGAGLVSNLALIANLFFLIGALASLGAALTLPGIAGIVLTIGMAVDANEI